ncbi:hypothetical protein GFD17_04465 [Bifidobacterium sp. SMB2]|uniref:Phage minor structural protein n=1 Tax=Bifidobacterium saimiriisciurei TaxID=2661627 RepID=A0ABX0CDC6_9BIFI|nr:MULTISPECIES: hypothetical protein [Bifidobacterium]NEG96023.1 hypothetical protein [Bifidobacterium sp. SMB2]NEH10899.1 hypothetical protein [Bifidobacterium saimiriisciurei]
MDQIIISVTASVLFAALSAVGGILWQRVKGIMTKQDVRDEALRALLFDKIARLHAETVEAGRPASVEIKRRADVAWDAYRALDPDGTSDDGTTAHLHAEIIRAHASEDPHA